MLIKDTIEVKINNRNITYYKNKGYDCKSGTTIQVKIEEVHPGSPILEKRICDCCAKEYERRHSDHLLSFNRFNKDVCRDCFENNMEIKKIIQSYREKTFIEKYGVNNPSFVPEIVEKIAQTTYEHYGERNCMQVPELRAKQQESLIENYGVSSPFHSPIILERFIKSMSEGNSVKTSQQQKACYQLLLEHNYNATLNYPESMCSLDVCIECDNNIKIDLEYDGSFWHDDAQKIKDRRRDEYLKSIGYKIFRIESERGIPKWEDIEKGIQYLLEDESHTFAHITIDNQGNII